MANDKMGAKITDGNYPPPFGDGKGGAIGPAKGANDFLTNASGNGTKTGGRDFTQENYKSGELSSQEENMGANPESIPDGGRWAKLDPGKVSSTFTGTAEAAGTERRPFKLGLALPRRNQVRRKGSANA